MDRYASAAVRRHTRTVFGIALLAVVLPATRAFAQSAKFDYKQGQEAEARQDYDTAYSDYQKAFQKDPGDLSYRMAVDRIKTTDSNMHLTRGRTLFRQGNLGGALAEFLHASEIDPGNEAAEQEIAKVRSAQGLEPQAPEATTPEPAGEQLELDEMGSPVQLKPISNVPISLHMNGDSKVIYQAIGKAAGINVLFDPDYTSRNIQVDLNNVTLLDALRIVGALSNTFWHPITSNSIFVAQNTRVKRTELDEEAVQTFYLTNAWQQNDLNDVQTALRNVLPNTHVYGVADQNAIVMRGTPDELLLAQKLIDDLDKPRSEVLVDFGVLEVSKNWEKTLGLAWPSSFGVQLLPPTSTSSTTTSSSTSTSSNCTANSSGQCLTLSNIAHLNSNDFAVTVGAATLNLLLTDSSTQILQDPRIRATDGQKATLTIGSRIPIATGSYSAPGITATAAIGYAQTQFQYIDVGVKIEMTPTVHYNDDVTLKVHVEVSSESGSQTIEGVTEPIISQRVADQVIRLKEGEASILGGIQDNQNQQSWTGIPGLSSIPILKYLFGSKDRQVQNDEIVFVVVPHVVRGPELDEENLRPIDTGEGQSIELRHVSVPTTGSAQTPRPATPVESSYGTVPATTAPGAAMEALNQMRASTENMEQPPPVSNPAAPIEPKSAAPPGAALTAEPGPLSFSFIPPAAPVADGTTFQVPIRVDGGVNISSVPLQFRYDPAKLTLVNATDGGFLSRDGQPIALIHRDDGPGNVTIVASRPPGSAGMSGSGVLCVLTFQAKAPGPAMLQMTRAGAVTNNQLQVPAQSSQAEIVVK